MAQNALADRRSTGFVSRWFSGSARANAEVEALSEFACASTIGGVAGYPIVSQDAQITPPFGLWATFKGSIAMMLSCMGSIPGAIVGGLLLGVVEAQSIWYLGTEYRDPCAYALLFLSLVFPAGRPLRTRPHGAGETGAQTGVISRCSLVRLAASLA